MHNNAAKKVMFSEEEKRFCIRKRELPGCIGKFNALFITDTHSHMTKRALDDFISDIGSVDVIFVLGDMSEREQLLLKNYYEKARNIHFLEITIITDSSKKSVFRT